VYARSDCDHADAVMACGPDVSRRVADCADDCVSTGEVTSASECVIVDVGTGLKAIAEGLKVEVLQ